MAESLSVGVSSISYSKIYLTGSACGDTGKYYCIDCYVYSNGLMGDVGNNNYTYTFFGGGSCLNMEASGCYIPNYGDGQYRFYLTEVSMYGCDHFIRTAAIYTLTVSSEPETCTVNVAVADQFNTAIAGAQVRIPTANGATTIATNYQGTAVGFTLEESTFHTIDIISIPSGWEKTSDSTRTVVPTGNTTYKLYVNKVASNYEIDFYVCDQALYPISGAVCSVGGKSATTNSSGMASITLEGEKSYNATCNAPAGYNCDCGGCSCNSGSFTLYGNKDITFYLEEDKLVQCQQDFKVLDQNGQPVANIIVGCEDRTDYTSFEVYGHSGTGTMSDGTVSTLQTISGRAYNFYVSQFPAGYEVDLDGDSIFFNVTACTNEIVFRVKNLSVVPDPCNVNVCVQDQDGSNITGVAIYIKDVGTVHTKSDISMFGCTGNIGLVCGTSTTVTATVPSGYDAVKVTETFTAVGNKTIILTIKESSGPTTCSEKNKTECDAISTCHWWDSDNSCHDTPEQNGGDYPTLEITSDIDTISGLDAYVDGAKVGSTPVTVSFDETDVGKEVSVAGVFADIIGTKGKNVTLVAGSNTVNIEFLMDNKEIIAGGTIAGFLLFNYI